MEFPRVIERRADLAVLLDDETILHIEFQSHNDKDIAYRDVLLDDAKPYHGLVPSENSPAQDSYHALLIEIKERIRSAQYAALRAVNLELLSLYWDMGRLIDQRQKGETWGRSVVENLAKDLRAEFPGVGGFSAANLWRIKQFYEAYAKNEKLAPLVREISWTKNLVILERCKDSAERQFYLERTKQFGWTKNVLIHQIENQTYEKTANSKPSEACSQRRIHIRLPGTCRRAQRASIGTSDPRQVEPFLLEMGGMFSFVGSQYRLDAGGKEYTSLTSCSSTGDCDCSLPSI